MTEGSNNSADLPKLIEHHARILRMLIVVGTCAIMATQFYCLTETFNSLPGTIIINMMGQLDKFHHMWGALDAAPPKALEATPPLTPTKK